MIDSFGAYADKAQNQELRSMLLQHMQAAMQAYEELAQYTHDYSSPSPYSFANSTIQQTSPQQIRYSLQQPAPVYPRPGKPFDDIQIASCALVAHKNSAKNHIAASLECADPNVRMMLLNGAIACTEMAYELFLFMNQAGMYQVPTMHDHTAKTMLHAFQSPYFAQQQSGGMPVYQQQAQSDHRHSYGSQPMPSMPSMPSMQRPTEGYYAGGPAAYQQPMQGMAPMRQPSMMQQPSMQQQGSYNGGGPAYGYGYEAAYGQQHAYQAAPAQPPEFKRETGSEMNQPSTAMIDQAATGAGTSGAAGTPSAANASTAQDGGKQESASRTRSRSKSSAGGETEQAELTYSGGTSGVNH